MQEIEIEIHNDGKDKSQSWQLSINIYLHKFDTDDEPSCVNSFTLTDNLDITMYDSSYEKLMENAFVELDRLNGKGYIMKSYIKILHNLFERCGEEITSKIQEGQNKLKIRYYIDTTELSFNNIKEEQ